MAKSPRLNSRLRKALKDVKKPQSGWMDETDKIVGRADGTILTGIAGMIYVRDPQNGQVLTVYNSVAPTDRPGLMVRVGRLVGEAIYRVKGMRDSHGVPSGGGQISPHSHNDLFIGRERFLPFLVLPIEGEGHTVQIYGDVIIKDDRTFTAIENQTLDLSSYVPATGALYALIEADDDGVISVVTGTEVDSKELLTPADIPAHTDGSKPSCAVRLFGGQEQLYRDPNSINDFVDVRSLTSGGGGGSGGYTPPATTAADDFQVGDGSGNWIKKTLEETVIILMTLLDTVYSAIVHTHAVNDVTDLFNDMEGSPAPIGIGADGTSDYAARRDHSHAFNDGWIERVEVWTRTGNHTFTVAGDVTERYRKGTRVRYRDGGGDEYGVVSSSSHAAGTTTINLLPNTDYAIAAATITDKYTSYIENPSGFPQWFNFSSNVTATSGTITTSSVNQARWDVKGKTFHCIIDLTVTTNGTGAGILQASIPVTPDSNTLAGTGRNISTGAMIQVFGSTGVGALARMVTSANAYPIASGDTIRIMVWTQF